MLKTISNHLLGIPRTLTKEQTIDVTVSRHDQITAVLSDPSTVAAVASSAVRRPFPPHPSTLAVTALRSSPPVLPRGEVVWDTNDSADFIK